ncbi:hypothetical protein A1D29_04065 [Pasteurellaceae bacterium Orientalotternb1]|nr:hypothetical protein A1D29_04065 [Pasteurellaceae bacterium Orientalotternb1]
MNKNRYKLIFSKAKSCLIPVAEFINSVTEDHNSEKKSSKFELETYRLSTLSKSIQEIINPKTLSALLLTLPTIALANNPAIEVDSQHKNNASVEFTPNNVAVIDIAKPEYDGISDNRFNRFNVENGAVFKNNKQAETSTLIGHQEKSKHLGDTSAKAILAQVTGKEETKLKGGLEVLGDKADLLIVNPNGVTVNGVQTFNTERFVVSTSDVIDPKNGLNLSVDKGTVTIEKDGLATDGLRYVDIVAKKIVQKGAIKHNTAKTMNPADINLVAGSSTYDVKKRKAKSKGQSSDEIILTGEEAGSMYGDHINFIVTDNGAGVNHKGIILSESDIVIQSQNGKVNVSTVQSKSEVKIKNAENTEISDKLDAKYIDISSKKTILRNNASIKAKQNVKINSNVELEGNSKIRGNGVNVQGEELNVKSKQASILGRNVSINSKIDNKGTISARYATIDSNKLKNSGNILAEEQLDIYAIGVDKVKETDKKKGFQEIDSKFSNTGVIQSNNNASLTFKDNTSFSAIAHSYVPQAKNTLTISANYFTIEDGQEIQAGNNLTVNSEHFLNNGILTAGNILNVSNAYEAKNNGLIGAGKAYKFKALDIHNNIKGIFHSEGTSDLSAAFDLINDGKIISRDKLTISTSHLINNVILSGDVIEKDIKVNSSQRVNRNALRSDIYKIEGSLRELDGSNVKVKSMGQIRAENGLEFIQQHNQSDKVKGIDNYGIINVKGEFINNGTARIYNGMKSLTKNFKNDFFKRNSAQLTLKFQPFGRFWFVEGALSGEASHTFYSVGDLLNHLFSDPEALRSSSLYSAYTTEYLKNLKNLQSPQLQMLLTQVLGQNWENQNFYDLQRKWRNVRSIPVEFYPNAQAKFLADSITGEAGIVQNGKNGIRNKFEQNLNIGDTSLNLPKITLKDIVAPSEEEHTEINLSILAEILNDTNLFIDRSLQLERPVPTPPILKPSDEDKDLLKETEEEKAEKLRKAQEEARKLAEAERLRKEKRAEEERKRQREIAEERRKKAEAELQEKQRLERQALEEEQSRLKKEKIAQEELERRAREFAEKQRQEKLALEEKLKKEQEEAEKKLHEEQLAREKAEAERIKEYKEKLLAEKRKAEELASKRALLGNDTRPRVEIDPLYHTRVKYINQDEYTGADYFFNKVVPEQKDIKKINVIGDNYFEHQLITRTIEKKVDNHLSLKYDLNNRDLVKRLMDNAVNKSQELNLTVGKALTKEQQAALKEDIIWYVKSEIKGKEVFIPQVYLAPETLADAKKYQGLGQAIIKAREIELKTKEFYNDSTIIGNKVDIESQGKIISSGNIFGRDLTKLKGKDGVELISKTLVDEKGNTITQQANVISEGHVHLEADLDKKIDLTAANVKGKTGFIKSKDLNVKDTYEVTSEHNSHEITSKLTGKNIGYSISSKVEAKSVGSNVKFDHLHLALSGDLNQEGSNIDTEHLTGIIQGNYNTKAGKNYTKSEKSEMAAALEITGLASLLGKSVQSIINEQTGSTVKTERSDQAGANLDASLALRLNKEFESKLQHRSGQLNAKSGGVYVLGNADIGGVDINSQANTTPNKDTQTGTKDDATKQNETENAAKGALEQFRNQKQKALQSLSKEQIAELMAEKDAQFYIDESKKRDQGFSLSANSISSTKEKDIINRHQFGFNLKAGLEIEAHSALADLATGISKEVLDAKAGLKQDGTAALQHTSEAIGVITGDLIGGSVKRKAEIGASSSDLQESRDVRTIIGGKTTLIARGGDVTLNNVQSTSDSELALIAKENVNIHAGITERKEESRSSSAKVFDGSNVSCGVMQKGCSVGVTSGVEASEQHSTMDGAEVQNSLLQGKKIKISAGKDFNLVGSNIKAGLAVLDVEGKTNIISQQDHIDRVEHANNVGLSAGASVNTALELKPTGNISTDYRYEYEKGKTIKQQAGIVADRVVGELNDVNLKAGHIVDHNQGKDVVIKGKVTHGNLQDSLHKDGGSVGTTIGINERGTAQLGLRGGRVEQRHYEATQKSTLSGLKPKIDTDINTDINKSKIVQQDDHIASSRFEFDVLDIAELGQKARDKIKSRSNQSSDGLQSLSRGKSITDNDTASKSAKETGHNVNEQRTQITENENVQLNKNNKRVLPELPSDKSSQPKIESNNIESDYAEIPAFTPKTKQADVESDYAEISTFSPNAKSNQVESDYAEISSPSAPKVLESPQRSGNAEDLYAKLDKSPDARAKAEERSRLAEAAQPKKSVVETDDTPPALPPRPQAEENPYATIDKSPDARAKAEERSRLAEAAQPKKSVVETDDTPPALPPRPQAEENPYATIDKSPDARAKAEERSRLAEAAQPKKSVVETDDTPPALPPRPQAEENPYATIDKSPEARAKAEERSRLAEAAQPKKSVVETDDTPPALPPRPNDLTDTADTNTQKSLVTEVADTTVTPKKAETIESPKVEKTEQLGRSEKAKESGSDSLLGKLKKWFKGSDSTTAKKSAKPEQPKAAENVELNYDNLPDSANLKGLLSLEKQRNADFDEQVLKNPKFLEEAKDAAKKYIPESTIKQMGDSPEFNEILTEGARKVEQRINDAVTFKPSVEEFKNIQNLVKQLPKGTVLKDVNAMTDSVTDALAATSKTIQKNPELKEQIRGAIDAFLTNSKGKDLTVEMIEKLNHGLRPDEGPDRLSYKTETLTKENAVFSSPEASKIQLKATVDFINQARKDGVEPSVLAGLVYQRLIAYHPFAEGNGRMARVIVNKILLDAGYPPFTKFNESFETQIIPQTNSTAKSATSSEVVSEFLKELGQKSLPAGSEPLPKVQKMDDNQPLVEPKVESQSTEIEAPTKKATPIDDKVQSQTLVENQRSVLQKIKDKFQPLRVGKKIKDVRDSVEEFGGEVSFKYAQSKGEVFNEIIKHTETEHGTCEATCAYWIAKKVNDDQSLFNEIYPNGKEGKLDKQAFEKIKKLQTEFINSGSSATQQFKFTESWLNEQGVNVKQKQVGEYSRKDEVSGTVTNTDVKALTKAILETNGNGSGVKKISINLQGGSHTVAASVKGEQVTFFDPNFGELTFKSHQQFENWFKDAFWSKSGYAGTDSNKRFFNVINYETK